MADQFSQDIFYCPIERKKMQLVEYALNHRSSLNTMNLTTKKEKKIIRKQNYKF